MVVVSLSSQNRSENSLASELAGKPFERGVDEHELSGSNCRTLLYGTSCSVQIGHLSRSFREKTERTRCSWIHLGGERSPENDHSLQLTKKVDVWGFGVVVYQMKYGRKPFSNFCKTTVCERNINA